MKKSKFYLNQYLITSCVSIVFALLLSMFILAGCSATYKVNFEGTWILSEYQNADGTVYNDENFSALGSSGADIMTLHLNSDGSATFSSLDTDPLSGLSLIWEANDDDSAIVLTSTSDGGQFQIDYDDETEMLIFEYQQQVMKFVKS